MGGGLPMAAQDHLNASLVIGQEAVGEFEAALRCVLCFDVVDACM